MTTVSIRHLMPFTWGTAGVVIAYNLYLKLTYSMSHAERSKPTIVRRGFSDVEPFVVYRGCFTRGSASGNPSHVPV